MAGVATQAGVSTAAFESLALLQQLTLEAGLSENLRQLTFRILNRSIGYCAYDRAALWAGTGRHARLLGVSGSADVRPRSPLVCEWRELVTALGARERATIVDVATFPERTAAWERLAQRTAGLSVVWLPIVSQGRTVAGVWLERWRGARFDASDVARLEPLALGYGVAWRSVAGHRGRVRQWLQGRGFRIVALIAAALLAALVFVRVPLRIVAPCEVVPEDPVAITAPLTGVIDEVVVLPGRTVTAGELLALYDKRVALEELKVSEEQVRIIASDLQRARVQAFDNPAARAEIALLTNRLEQEQTRLRIARHRAEQLEIRAPVAGTLMFDDPHEWRGRPVQVGERVMMIVDPQRTKLRVELPESDNIAFDRERPLTVILDADPRAARQATLRFLANHSQIGPKGVPHFRAEAEWIGGEPGLKLGLQGSAVLYGDDVPLGYWLLRRPLATVRKFVGF